MSESTPDETGEEVEPPTLQGCPVTESRGQTVVHVLRGQYLDVMKAFGRGRLPLGCDLPAGRFPAQSGPPPAGGVDAERFEVVVGLLDIDTARRLRVRVQVPDTDAKLP